MGHNGVISVIPILGIMSVIPIQVFVKLVCYHNTVKARSCLKEIQYCKGLQVAGKVSGFIWQYNRAYLFHE